jgi:hypothetical protein
MAVMLTLPDFATEWPFKRTENPHYNESVRASNAEWISSFNLLHGKARTAFDACNIPIFVSLIYPRANPHLLRLSTDYMGWAFCLDELGDLLADKASYQKFAKGVMDVLL